MSSTEPQCKKKILLVGTVPPPVGGVSVHLERLFQYILREGAFEVKVLDLRNRRVLSLEGSTHSIWSMLKAFFEADCVHLHISHQLRVLIAFMGRILGKKVVYTYHGLLKPREIGFKLVAALSHRLILVNGTVMPKSKKILRKSSVIPPFLPGQIRNPLPEFLSEICHQYKKTIVSTSFHSIRYSLVNGKDCYGFDTLINAFELLPNLQWTDPTLLVLLDSTGNGYGLIAPMVARAKTLPHMKILHVREQVCLIAMLKEADLFVRASRTDGDSLAIREALEAGVPVIASDCTTRPKGVGIYSTENAAHLAKCMAATLTSSIREPVCQPDFGQAVLDVYRALD